MVDPRAGSTVGLQGMIPYPYSFSINQTNFPCVAYAAACFAPPLNITLPKEAIALTLPSDWDGPASLPLSTGVTVVAVITAGILGVGGLIVLSNM